MRKSRRRMAPNTTTTTTTGITSYVTRWAFPALWALLPFIAGPALADALDPRARAVQLVVSIGAWLVWGATLVASLVPRTTSLTFVRIAAPASILSAGWAALAGPSIGTAAAGGFGLSLAVTIIVLAAPTGEVFVNGSSYGDERRLPLRPPAALLLGPIQVAWIVCVGGAAAGPLLLAAERWAFGIVALVIGWALTFATARSLHGLSNRWVVFVPAGFVLHDLMALTDPLLVPRRMVTRFGPAPADTTATDFTLGSYGLALQVDLAETFPATPIPRRTRPGQRPSLEAIEIDSLLFTPSRPGAVLREASARKLAVA